MSTQVAVQKKETGFSMVTQESLGRRISINPREEHLTTVISRTSRMRGELTFEEGVKIDGEVQGSVEFGTTDGLCIISKSAVVEGDIKGPRAFILGTIQGDVDIDGVLLLAPTAVVIGNISYGRLIVCEGAQISGQLNMNTKKRTLPLPDEQPASSGVVRLKQANASR